MKPALNHKSDLPLSSRTGRVLRHTLITTAVYRSTSWVEEDKYRRLDIDESRVELLSDVKDIWKSTNHSPQSIAISNLLSPNETGHRHAWLERRQPCMDALDPAFQASQLVLAKRRTWLWPSPGAHALLARRSRFNRAATPRGDCPLPRAASAPGFRVRQRQRCGVAGKFFQICATRAPRSRSQHWIEEHAPLPW